MHRLIDLLVPASAAAWFPLLVESAIKSTAVIALAALLVLAFQRVSAARRHLIWAFALGALAVLPALLAALPAWKVASRSVAWVAPVEAPATAAAPGAATEAALAGEAAPTSEVDLAPAPVDPADEDLVASPEVSRASQATDLSSVPAAPAGPAARTSTPFDWRGALVMAWLVGALATFATFATGHLVLRLLLRDARRIRNGEWHEMANDAADQLRLSVPFALLQGRGVPVPVAFGLLRPRVLLPPEADSWPLERRRSVLLHELAHVQRHDCITQAVAQLACALFWFHPAVWWAEARLRVERERACDDRVLASRTTASDYADHLLDVVRSLRATRLAALGAVAFARKSSLEGRLIAVLDPSRDRRAVSARVAVPSALLAALVIAPFAALEPARVHAGMTIHSDVTNNRQLADIDPKMQMPSTLLKRNSSDLSLAHHMAWAKDEARKLGEDIWWVGWRVEANRGNKGGFLTDSEGFDLSLLGRHGLLTLDDVLLGREKGTSHDIDDDQQHPAALLVRFANGTPDRVRIQSLDLMVDFSKQPLFWFERVTDDQAYDWLVEQADQTRSTRLREIYVKTVGFLPNSDRVRPFLMGMMDDPSAKVRRAAADGLGRHPSPYTLRVLREHAKSDPSSEVRRQCVESLGELKTEEALNALIGLAGADSDAETRRTAFDVMGHQVMGEGDEKKEHGRGITVDGMFYRTKTAEEAEAKAERLAEKEELKAEKEMEKKYRNEKSGRMSAADYDVQRQAIESLGRYPEAQSLPRLRKIAESSPQSDLRAQAVESIARLKTPAAMAVVDEAIWTNTMEQPRLHGVEVLAHVLDEKQALDKLEHIAEEHPDPRTRRMAIEVIGRYECERSSEFLVKTIESRGNPECQRQAVESLGRREDASVDRRLYEIAQRHESEQVRRQAVEMIGHRGGEHAAERLLAIAKGDGAEDARRQAVESLGRLDRDDVKEMLLHLVRSDSPAVARQAVESLGRIEEDSMAELAEIARTHPSGEVRRQAVETMSRRDPDRALPLLEEILKQGKRKTAGL